jgi:uncharacterized membrane protein
VTGEVTAGAPASGFRPLEPAVIFGAMPPGRRHEISRLEAFSDAVFAFALTLLVVALEVPKNYGELMRTMNAFLPFACCFALLVWIWYEHNLFFRRFGLQDNYTVVLNSALLFVVLFYVYPLKFMFSSAFARLVPALRDTAEPMRVEELANAAAVYSCGFVVLFLMFVLLYHHVYAKRAALELTALEVFDAKTAMGHHTISMGVGLLALGVAVAAPRYSPLSPMVFFLMGPGHWWYGVRSGRGRSALEKQLDVRV